MQKGLFQRRQHYGKRPIGAMLPFAQAGNGFRISGIDQQLKAAQSFHGDNSSGQQGLDGGGHGRRGERHFLPLGIEQLQLGPQCGQAIGWAWKRRSVGFSYSARHSGHNGKPAIAVRGRS